MKKEDFSPFVIEEKPRKCRPPKKLINDQTNKERYLIHYRDLFISIRHGFSVKIIHTVYQFKNSPWSAKYIKCKTEQRIKAKTDFEKHFYKTMINFFYGNFTWSIRKRLNLDLIDKSDTHRILKCQSKCCFDDKNATIEKLNIHSINKGSVKFVKPKTQSCWMLYLRNIKMYNVWMLLW